MFETPVTDVNMLDIPVTDVNMNRIFNRKNEVLATIDTCVCMEDGFDRFMVECVFPHMKPDAKIYIEVAVLYELQKHSVGDNRAKALSARKALIFLQKYRDRFCVVGRETDRGVADSFFLSMLTRRIGKYHVILITEDRALMQSAQNLYHNMSCIRGKRSLTIIQFSSRQMKTWYEPNSAHYNGHSAHCAPFKKSSGFRLKLPNPVVFTESKAITLGSPVGSGAKSRVFEADSDRVAKVLHPTVFDNDETYENFFLRITKLMQIKIEHEHIVVPDELIFDSDGDDKSAIGYLMRRIRGKTVHALLNHGQLSFEDRISIVYQLADALAFLSEKGVSVPDLRLDNLLIDSDMSLQLIDCDGFSVLGVPAEKSDNYLYDPPRGFATSDPMSFRFALISFQILSGKHPYLQPSLSIRDAIDALDFQMTSDREDVLYCLSDELRDAYINTFRHGKILVSMKTWRALWETYREEIEGYSVGSDAI